MLATVFFTWACKWGQLAVFFGEYVIREYLRLGWGHFFSFVTSAIVFGGERFILYQTREESAPNSVVRSIDEACEQNKTFDNILHNYNVTGAENIFKRHTYVTESKPGVFLDGTICQFWGRVNPTWGKLFLERWHIQKFLGVPYLFLSISMSLIWC